MKRKKRRNLRLLWLLMAMTVGGAMLVACSEEKVSDMTTEQRAALQKGQSGPSNKGAAKDARKASNITDRAKDRYIVVFKRNTLRGLSNQKIGAKMKTWRTKFGAKTHRMFRHTVEGMAVTIGDKASLQRLKNDPQVAYVVPDRVVSVDGVQNDPTWGLDRIDQETNTLDSAYTYESSGDDVHVYVIDTGLYADHYDFAGRVGEGIDIIDPGTSPNDCHGHGTHVAGTAVGSQYGVAKRAIVHPVRIFDCDGYGLLSDIIAGVDWVTANHVKPAVANMSLNDSHSQLFDDAVATSIDAGVFYAVAAGNDHQDDACNWSPASVSRAVTVAASDDMDTIADFSNIGSCVDIFAPGVDVVSAGTIEENSFFTGSGTSMASPHVAGAAALLLSKAPSMTPDEVTQAILDAAVPGVINGISDPTPNLLLNVEALNLYGTGSINIATNTVGCNSTWAISVADQNLTGVDAVSIEATTSNGDEETVYLERTNPDSDSLHGRLFFSDSAGAPVIDDGYIQTADGVTVTLTYEDAENAEGQPQTVTETLIVDCTLPTISNASVTYAYRNSADIEFDISESAYVQVKYGQSCDNLTISDGSQGAVPPTHLMRLEGLEKETTYYYTITATDRAGNTGVEDDNGGLCYQFTTATERYFEDFESEPVDFDLGTSQWRITDGCAATAPGHSVGNTLYFGDDSTCTFQTHWSGGTNSPTVAVDFDKNPSVSFNYYENMGMSINEVWVYVIVDGNMHEIAATIKETVPKIYTYYDQWIPVSIPIAHLGEGIQDVNVQFNLRAMFNDGNPQGFFVDDLAIAEWTPGTGSESYVYEAEDMTHSTGGAISGGWNIWSNGYVAFNHDFAGGSQEMIISAAGEYASGWPEMRVTVNGQQVYHTTVASADWTDYAFEFAAPLGNAEVRIYFTNDYYEPPQDRNLLIDKVTIIQNVPGPNPGTLAAELDVYTSWDTGFCANIDITNNGTAATVDWTVVVDIFDNEIVNSWNVVPVSGSGQITFQPTSSNRFIEPGQTDSSTGFCASRSGDTTGVIVGATPVYN